MPHTFYDIHLHIVNIAHVPLRSLIRRDGIGLWVAARGLPFTKIEGRVRHFMSTAEKAMGPLLQGIVDAARRVQRSGKIVLTPLLMHFEHEDCIKVFGSDHYMHLITSPGYEHYAVSIRKAIGRAGWRRLSEKNPAAFLGEA